MTEGTPKAIEPKGITRNATKIGVQDGQAEDLINLRFMDGSWRASGNGRQIENMPTGTIYEQLYVHTNVYHHLLGVDNGVLYWFAEIDNDGVTFYPLDGTSDRSLWPEDKQDLPTERVALTNVVGDIWITQTGHLLTVIDEADDFEFFVFKTGDKQYAEVNVDVNGKPSDRSLYPFGQVHFNFLTGDTSEFLYTVSDENQYIKNGSNNIDYDGSPSCVPKDNENQTHAAAQVWHSLMLKVLKEATKNNRFTGMLVICAAVRLYDGSYAYASNPILINPRERFIDESSKTYLRRGYYTSSEIVQTHEDAYDVWYYKIKYTPRYIENNNIQNTTILPVFTSETCSANRGGNATYGAPNINAESNVFGYDIIFSLENVENIIKNSDVFSGIDIFITHQVYPIKISERAYEEGIVKAIAYKTAITPGIEGEGSFRDTLIGNVSYHPKQRQIEDVIYDLMHSPMYLLKQYSIEEIAGFEGSTKVNLNNTIDKGKLENITQQITLPTESLARTTYLPKVSYQYNGRLHIANYKTYPFFGYPIDLFHLHNHSVKVQENAWFPNNTTQKVLPNLTDNNDAYLQYTKVQKAITNYPDLVNNKAPYFIVKTYINSEQGEQVVCRYIQAYDPSTPKEGRADFIEDLNPLLTYPDARAKKMEIFYVDNYTTEDYIDQANVKYKACAWVRMKEFKLTPHPYLNIAYYMDSYLHPIKLADFEQVLTTYEEDIYEVIVSKTIPELKALIKMENAEEYFPNGLKVSETDQPMVFPVENTYQVGSAQILALMSNTIAVGTGQTGDAPLYVFCKDGVYALYVDSSGQMAYPNARILARDVCNNPRSVTPIDAGVVFTTDRGLMMISGEQVQEIGAPAEGDVVQFWNAGSVDYSKIATASMQQIAGLPSELCSTTDFLTYLQDKGTLGKAAIINYNHNMRELMVSNPNYPYSYVLDREGNWSRRNYTAAQYVNNYPTSYRVDADGHFYKVDDEGNANTSLEHRKEADNKIFYLSNVIKLDSIGFKQAYRFVVRGYFETLIKEVERVERAILQKSIDSRNFYIEEDSHVLSQTNLPVMNHLVGMSDVTNGLRVGDVLVLNPIGNPLAEAQEIVITEVTRDDVYLAQDVVITEGVTGFALSRKRTVIDHVPTNVACVVEGSYDGRKFKPLGYNRKSGKFRDIGCIVERTDVRFFRICLSGQVTGKTRIDYMEMSAGPSMLNTKIR